MKKDQQPIYIVAELSANHGGSVKHAAKTIRAAAEAGADAVKLQTYTADTLTIDCDNEYFRISGGTAWDGRTLYDLYQEAHTPWEWHAELQQVALGCGLVFFSTPFDATAVDFLEELNVAMHKVASFELVDIALLKKIGCTGKPVIMSTGMASEDEIHEALAALRSTGCPEVTLLKCTSAYPAKPEDANLLTLPDMARKFGCKVGLSDHTMGIAVPVAAVALGACMVEKHFTLSRKDGGPDSGFSLEPHEFKEMVEAVRTAEKALGQVRYGGSASEEKSKVFRRSLFVVEDISEGDVFSPDNVRSIRPGHGLPPKDLELIVGKTATCEIRKGTPLKKEYISE
ncbi:MAG: pseudaminic acid synthase [Verrucomicrobia bacterium]|nr:MAG: pseudaminic acid synthase [Verrucomicrobiota bacterium]